MRMTHEADYAVRIAYCLASRGTKVGAKEISESTGVTLRFSLKILRKMILSDLVVSYKGVNGGYALSKSPYEISLGEIIEKIDGPIAINHCLTNEFDCTKVNQKHKCDFHNVFGRINASLRKELYNVSLGEFVTEGCSCE